jgi:hypothetical protein
MVDKQNKYKITSITVLKKYKKWSFMKPIIDLVNTQSCALGDIKP